MLVFAAMNGTIAGGIATTDLSESKDKPFVSHIATIACDVDLEFVDDQLKIGDPPTDGTEPPQIDTLSDIMITQPNSTRTPNQERYDPAARPQDTLNELALWMTVAPITNGVSVEGGQPLYCHNSNGLPAYITTPGLGDPDDQWNMSYIEHFIKVSIGASAIGDSTTWPNNKNEPVTLTSRILQYPSQTLPEPCS
ncbi:hypothetical protein N0V90_008283 [Kalmusia sp. IMI 367209]|nr:hypothetical protein N0V90_008283 [Kalmusia sp. IMI 367209]